MILPFATDALWRANHGATWITATAGLTLLVCVRDGLAVNPVIPMVLFGRG